MRSGDTLVALTKYNEWDRGKGWVQLRACLAEASREQ